MAKNMKAYVTSIGEQTTDLCIWALERNGFDCVLVSGDTSLATKLKDIYDRADDDFLRVDADIIVNKWFNAKTLSWLDAKNPDIWWWQFLTFDFLKLNITHSISYIKKEAIPHLRLKVELVEKSNRPETEMSRIKEFYEPRRFDTYSDEIVGLHGYKADLERVKKTKHVRNQIALYDFEMAERLNQL